MTDILKELEDIVFWKHTICNDPLNGCPRDFAENYDLKIHKVTITCYTQGITEQEIDTACKRGYNRAMGSFKAIT